MTSDVDKEIEAIHTVLGALLPLEATERESVIEYVFKRLGIQSHTAEFPSTQPPPQAVPSQTSTTSAQPKDIHIKELKEEKLPKSAIEMAVLVAYYLSHIAPEPERKQTVIAKDLDTYFKIAEFKLPQRQDFTLPHAKKSGYFDFAGNGEYKLNPVGYNLVVHSMPRTGTASVPRSRKAISTPTTKASKGKKKNAKTK